MAKSNPLLCLFLSSSMAPWLNIKFQLNKLDALINPDSRVESQAGVTDQS